jgi:hypothetical protein
LSSITTTGHAREHGALAVAAWGELDDGLRRESLRRLRRREWNEADRAGDENGCKQLVVR